MSTPEGITFWRYEDPIHDAQIIPAPPVVAAPTRTTLHYADNPEPTDQLTAAVERGHISVRAARRMGWTR